jgi:hypothetical protein
MIGHERLPIDDALTDAGRNLDLPKLMPRPKTGKITALDREKVPKMWTKDPDHLCAWPHGCTEMVRGKYCKKHQMVINARKRSGKRGDELLEPYEKNHKCAWPHGCKGKAKSGDYCTRHQKVIRSRRFKKWDDSDLLQPLGYRRTQNG